MRSVIITRGLPGSGKTTWSRDWVRKHASYKRINRDDLRMMLCNGAYNQKAEEAVLKARHTLIVNLLRFGLDLVLDEAHLSEERLEESLCFLKLIPINEDIRFKIKDFTNVPLEVCIQRDSFREGKAHVGPNFIKTAYKKYVKGKPPKEEKWITLS